jgi:hypothetical protein
MEDCYHVTYLLVFFSSTTTWHLGLDEQFLAYHFKISEKNIGSVHHGCREVER